jgi:hypothetical protein
MSQYMVVACGSCTGLEAPQWPMIDAGVNKFGDVFFFETNKFGDVGPSNQA